MFGVDQEQCYIPDEDCSSLMLCVHCGGVCASSTRPFSYFSLLVGSNPVCATTTYFCAGCLMNNKVCICIFDVSCQVLFWTCEASGSYTQTFHVLVVNN